ncbi:FHA domain-containing protein [Streptomyces sp. NPDC000410]|uniref:FHA domain-containing protein n=1 Tax=Streptomyces sp. NPDC000410 TaxID=3154254 RepID=UPI003331F8A8
MQIRLTVLAPRSGQSVTAAERASAASAGRAPAERTTAAERASTGRARDVLVTAPAGTALAAVASGLAAAVSGPDAPPSGTIVLYAGQERLDAQRCALGEPPLVDGAVLSLHVPAEDEAATHEGEARARLDVVAGPDAGGVHLLHGGQIRIGRAADADVPLDDPDVSRLHCAVTVGEDGRVTVADLGSTNGTTLDGAEVGPRPARLAPGALLRLGESALRLTPPTGPAARLATTPDGEGHLRVRRASPAPAGAPVRPAHARTGTDAGGDGPTAGAGVPSWARGADSAPGEGGSGPYGAGQASRDAAHGTYGQPHAYGDAAPGAPARPGRVPGDDGRGHGTAPSGAGATYPHAAGTGGTDGGRSVRGGDETHARAGGYDDEGARTAHGEGGGATGPVTHGRGTRMEGGGDDSAADGGPGARAQRPRGESGGRKRGIGAWARRFAGGRGDGVGEGAGDGQPVAVGGAPVVETWPDPAAVLLTALGPGPRLWERGPGHPEELVVRLGTADRADTPAVPVTVGLREAGSLGLAGPRARLAGLARSVVAQLAALHSPADLEIVLISTDRARSLEERRREWGWLGWLPQLRPGHGQDCRLLLAYDRDQATARAAELTRRLDDGPLGAGWPSADRRAIEDTAARHAGPRTVLILDGDPGSSALRETTARLAGAGAAGGIHVVCLAETPAASPLSPVAATYEEACAVSLAFRECGAVALLSGDVATALRLLRTAAGQPAGHGTVATVDAVSAAWAERFGRALAPLRAADEGGGATGPGRTVTAPLPRSARLLDELGLARATPASLMARWASAADGAAVLGAGPRGPVTVDLAQEGPHLLIEGPAGSGRTELLRAIAASLAAADRPDRLGLLLVDGAGGERGEGLAACTELPHATEHLVASDPVRMREFAQSLGAELKRRAELLGRESLAEWHARRGVADRLVGQRSAPPAESTAWVDAGTVSGIGSASGTGAASGSGHQYGAGTTSASVPVPGRGDVESPDSGSLRLRARAALAAAERGSGGPSSAPADPSTTRAPHPLPRLVVLVDDYDALVAPALGSPGRPAAGSVVRALEAVARDGERLGVHLVATSARPDRTADTELAHGARLRIVLDPPPASPGPEDPAPGRGRLGHPDGRVTPFQGGRVSGRIPRTATQRPTVVELEWERMGDPPARRPVRELGNGPTDLALLASALDRAARSVGAPPLPPLTPARH